MKQHQCHFSKKTWLISCKRQAGNSTFMVRTCNSRIHARVHLRSSLLFVQYTLLHIFLNPNASQAGIGVALEMSTVCRISQIKFMFSKGQMISKGLLVSSNSLKKRTNEFVFTTSMNLFVCFFGEFEDTNKSF